MAPAGPPPYRFAANASPPVTAALPAVRRLTLTDFRCYDWLRLDVEPSSVVLTGPNGAGKTNVLEALSLLTPGRGLRTARLGEITRHGAASGAWAVAATLDTDSGPVTLGSGLVGGAEGAGGPDRRVVRVNGETARGQTELGRHVGALWLVPAMDGLFRDGASGRRRFLDRLVQALDPDHAGRCAAHAHALRERSRLLREGRGTSSWLDALEDTLARYGVAIAAARQDLVGRLSAALAEAVGPFPRATMTLDGAVETALARRPALAVEDWLRDSMAATRASDADGGGGTAIGPHRTDLLVRHAGRDLPAAQCSTGEQKAVLIALILAHARVVATARGGAPLLLLDEVVAHLDAERRAALAATLAGLGAQAWLTGTDVALFESFAGQAQFLRLADGNLVD
ncbi:DNA replication/repair protein RecF [Roseospira navarrensis]|uniref:DNA replication and repair protein RecF n=1 Tax=Roseospira navarrensis TaxID=140058 RepID=A0A7X1ZEP0_9PROT|nr:DNA replication/repair protein RecF [Roseospira navarrensis]MQX36912.1 DNA replication/repair protein RecF [Roseospira navarrensis]